MKSYKILIVSNNSFSKTGSNGRTLGNLFSGWDSDNIAQFCISTTKPDYDICHNYYYATDQSAIKAFLRCKKIVRSNIENCRNTEGNTVIIGEKKSFKTATKSLLRHIVWYKRWNCLDFWNWVCEFNPDMVLAMNSDSTFILDIARSVSEKKKIPLVMYNTEGFYFFKRDYMREEIFIDNICFKIYHRIYKRVFRRFMGQVSLSLHLNEMLCRDYEHEFRGRHEVLYAPSTMDWRECQIDKDNLYFCYLGNFGFDRPSALIEIAETLGQINASYKLHIFGDIPDLGIINRFAACPFIVIEGMVPYDDVKEIMYKSTILFHAESQSDKFEESLRYGFTTKIADSLSCGTPFLMYSSPNIAGADYLLKTGAGWFAQTKEELRRTILEILNDDDQRNKRLNLAKNVALVNHSITMTREKFSNMVCML